MTPATYDDVPRPRPAAGVAVPDDWTDAFARFPRSAFVPDRIWVPCETGGVTAVDRASDPDAWEKAIAADAPVITQLDDGAPWPGPASGGAWTSSSSMPTMVARMLAAADLRPGMAVLEIGTGTGWSTALTCALVGDAQVVSVEIDPAVAREGASSLARVGVEPTLVVGDGATG